jgi:16S rRNA (adenine1518-N6/adenine1519-N6)-dimethyltransferase
VGCCSTVGPVRLARSRTRPFQGCNTGSNPVRDVNLKKRFGQHFLSDRHILQRIVRLAAIEPEDTVVEIGPGAGALTRELAAAAKRVVAIEIDRDLVPRLRSTLPDNVEIVEGDALEIELPENAHLVGNLPYNISTPLLKKFIAARAHLTDVTVMLQKEVAERIRAAPDSGDYGPLSVLIQYYATPVWGFTVPPGAFTPRPKVDSAVIRLEWKPGIPNNAPFTDFVHHAFGSRRKKLLNNLVPLFPRRTREELAAALEAAGVSRDARAETLSAGQFLDVYNQLQ